MRDVAYVKRVLDQGSISETEACINLLDKTDIPPTPVEPVAGVLAIVLESDKI